jgi:HK97 family phage portal protein
MKLFGLEITRQKSAVGATTVPSGWNFDWLNNWTGGFIQEPFSGAWQRNQELRLENVLSFTAVYACITLIAGDIGKLGLRIMEERADGTEVEANVTAFSPVLRRPNRFQTTQKFIENWIVSKLTSGNTYVLKERSDRNTVDSMYVLNPALTRPMVSDIDGSIWYQLYTDSLVGITDDKVMVPASEIIHDVMTPLYHPLCGVSPITACGLAAIQGLNIQRSSSKFFANGARPSGLLTAPGAINEETAKRLKEQWETNYSGNNIGKVAVLGDGLAYSPMYVTAQDAQLIKVPPHKISIGPMPNYNNIEALDQQYYAQCLQTLIESVESLLDEGLGLTKTGLPYNTEFDLDDLLRMDTATQIRTMGEGISRGLMAPNEARERIGLGPVDGGDTPYLQQQNYSLEALNKRDSKDDPFTTTKPTQQQNAPAPLPAPLPPKALPAPVIRMEDWLKGLRDAGA